MKRGTKEMDNEENVLLLAMSILPGNKRENTYYYEKEDWYFKGISQLEPGTKLVLSLLEKEKQKLDKIVILASPQACGADGNESSVDFYKERINHFIFQDEGDTENGNLMTADGKNQSEIKIHNLSRNNNHITIYGEGTSFNNYKVVELKEPDDAEYAEYLTDAVEKIREGTDGKKINLYIDVQGGGRTEMTQMNSIIELLKKNDLEIKGRFATKFDPKSMRPHPIVEVSKEYDMANLVTAMTVFRKYGRGDELNTFFSKSEADSRERKLSEFIMKASDAIQLCDVNGFDDAIEQISKLKIDENDKSIYGIVCNEILEDYRELINTREEKSKNKYISQVEWCVNKNFLQQALTVIESKMPEEILEYAYFEDELEIKEITYHVGQPPKSLKDCIEEAKPDWEGFSNYLVRKWGETLLEKDDANNFKHLPLDSIQKDSWISEYGKEGTQRDFCIKWNEYDKDNGKKFYKTKPLHILETNCEENKTAELFAFIKLHMALKDQRNKINHAAEDKRENTEVIKDAIQIYIALAKKLSSYEEKDIVRKK